MSSSLIGRMSKTIFGYSKLFLVLYIFMLLGIRLGYIFFVFIFIFIFDIVVVYKSVPYNQDNVEYYYKKLEYKKAYNIFLIFYLAISVLCAIIVIRSIV